MKPAANPMEPERKSAWLEMNNKIEEAEKNPDDTQPTDRCQLGF